MTVLKGGKLESPLMCVQIPFLSTFRKHFLSNRLLNNAKNTDYVDDI